jgi:DNA-directed RNA polymerase subunit M/transcription elongation factor TFIIS
VLYIWKHQFKTAPVGPVARDHCPNCGKAVVFSVGKIKKIHKAYLLVPVMKRTDGHLVMCDDCGVSTRLPKKMARTLLAKAKKNAESSNEPSETLAQIGLGDANCGKCKTKVGAFDTFCPGCRRPFT